MGGIILIIIIAVVVFLVRRRLSSEDPQIENSIQIEPMQQTTYGSFKKSVKDSTHDPDRTNLDSWQIESSEITMGDELGRGSFGVVFQGIFRGEAVVSGFIFINHCFKAVKRIVHLNISLMEEFLREAKVMSKIPPHGSLSYFIADRIQKT